MNVASMESFRRNARGESMAIRTSIVRLVAAVNEGNARLDEAVNRLDDVFVNISLHFCDDVSAKGHTGLDKVVTGGRSKSVSVRASIL